MSPSRLIQQTLKRIEEGFVDHQHGRRWPFIPGPGVFCRSTNTKPKETSNTTFVVAF
jgi:hypothetical protein